MSCASSWTHRPKTNSTGGESGNSSPFWPHSAQFAGDALREGGWWKLGPIGLVAMILGFIVFWPIGLAILFYNIFKKKGWNLPMTAPPGSYFWSRPAAGNSAFEDWRRSEIERIERERQKLHDAEREFVTFLDELKRVKDREEFERFMQARKGWNGPEGEPRPEPAT
jgi:hypothetical protein